MTTLEFQDFFKASKLTQRALAEQLGYRQSTISGWYTGTHPIPDHAAKQIQLLQENAKLWQTIRHSAAME